MAVTTTNTNKPLNPRGNDQSPLAFNRAKLYSGKALDFDGVNDVLSLDGYTTFTGDFSLSMYIKTSTIAQRGLLCDSANNDGLLLWTTDEELVIRIDGTNHDWDTGLPIYNDHMNHLVVVRSGSEVTPYLNGVAGNSVTATSGTFAFNQFGRQTTSANYFDGQAANIKAFNVALTAAQVADLYNNPEKIVPTGVADSALKLWLPMQEGAGTTAYDGSGNGNHGTISGATWTHGIGAPVAQTAVIDWNKGTNLFLQSNSFDTTWTNSNSTETGGQSGYDGSSNAWKLESNSSSTSYLEQTVSASGVQTTSVYAKAGTTDFFAFYKSSSVYAFFNLSTGSVGNTNGTTSTSVEDLGDGWYRCSMTFDASTTYMRIYLSDANGSYSSADGSNIYIQNAQLENASTAGPFVLTLTTAQSSEVLIPKGITSGRDLFYNLFENVRKQAALNLDGNSWAEVHDNSSLDFGTDSFSIEAWARVKYVNGGSVYNAILTLGGNAASNTGLVISSSLENVFIYAGNASSVSASTLGNWVHLVGTYDKTNATFYINGSQVDQDARTATNITNTLAKQIGRDSETTRYYSDQIAQPRIYNRALTAEEVQRNYDAGKNIYS